jgi:UDP-N-acetylmuramate dehydrogenase
MALIDDLKNACPSVRENEALARHTSFAIGGPARWYADVNARDELQALRRVVRQHALPVFFLGAGSNILVADGGVAGLVIHLQGDFRKAVFDGAQVTAGAGAWLPSLAKQCAERGLAGIESLIGVPGTIGGGVVMNAGTRDGVLGDVVASIEVLNEAGDYQTFPGSEANFSYRHSKLEGSWVAGATLLLRPEDSTSIMKRLETYLHYRSQTQPLATNNCGSVFKNPPGGAAAKWVEQAGLKGKSIGGARVSERHANFIINEKGASAADVRALIEQIQSAVRERFGVELQPEVKFVGEWPR